MKKVLISLALVSFIIFGSHFCSANANIPDITEKIGTQEANYPIRDNALIMVLQPVPDGSGDYTMTICNKQAHCRQTSMNSDEIRYIGLFLEDLKPAIKLDLDKKLTIEQWQEKQNAFRDLYASYMNMYDNKFGELKTVTPSGITVKDTNSTPSTISSYKSITSNPLKKESALGMLNTIQKEEQDFVEFLGQNHSTKDNDKIFEMFYKHLLSIREYLYENAQKNDTTLLTLLSNNYVKLKNYGYSESIKQEINVFTIPNIKTLYIDTATDYQTIIINNAYLRKQYGQNLSSEWQKYLEFSKEETLDYSKGSYYDDERWLKIYIKWINKWEQFLKEYPNFALKDTVQKNIDSIKESSLWQYRNDYDLESIPDID